MALNASATDMKRRLVAGYCLIYKSLKNIDEMVSDKFREQKSIDILLYASLFETYQI